MSDIICVTNRLLCKEDFLSRIEKIALVHPKAIILREKDLSKQEYKELAVSVLEICRKHNTPCILHSFFDVASELDCKSLHLPLPILKSLSQKDRERFTELGASCHSLEDAVEAERLGCTYITAGHIFDTDCKKGVAGRGIDFLKTVCRGVSIPCYAIGGISPKNIFQIRSAGAKGACIMSGGMICDNVQNYFNSFCSGSPF